MTAARPQDSLKKDASYHLSAIAYNDGLADAAAKLAESDEVEHPEVKKWCRAVAKQHEFHSKRHAAALQKLRESEVEEVEVEHIDDGLDVPALPEESSVTAEDAKAVMEAQPGYHGNMPEPEVSEVAGTESAMTEGVDTNYHDAGTGRFVSEEYAEENPQTTVEVAEKDTGYKNAAGESLTKEQFLAELNDGTGV